MRKKRNDMLNVSQLFVLKHSSGPKVYQKNANNSFSQAVTGFLVGSESSNSWPELPASSKFLDYRENRRQTDNVSNSTSLVDTSFKHEASSRNDNGSGCSFKREQYEETDPNFVFGNNFPCLGGSRTRNPNKSSSSQVASSIVQDNTLLVKSRTIGKANKPKKNDPISIDIESAIELAKCRKKKDLKRLDPRRPRQLNPINCSGNVLDSSNPIRKKGKVRENKKKKQSTLKKLIEKMKQKPVDERHFEGALCKQFDGIALTKDHLDKIAKAKLHTSRFREYCTNFASRELVESVKELVITVRGFQDRMFKKDEVKARARRRYVAGFHECWKLLKANSFKVIIMATNIERNEALLQKIKEFVTESSRQGVPVVFAGTCTDLSFWLIKKNRTCILGIINYDGANESYNKMMSLFERDKAEYELKISRTIADEMSDVDDVAELRLQMLQKLTTN